jgi:hypothetical protein
MEKSRKFFGKKTQKKGTSLAAIPRFPYMPLTKKVRLRARNYDTGTSVTSPVWNRYGILEPLNIDPLFQAELFTMYKRARIHGCTLTLKLHNLGTEPIEMCVASLPYSYVTGSANMNELVDKPGSRRVTVSGAGGMDRATLIKSVSSRQVLGNEWGLADYDFDAAQANTSTPISADEPAWTIGLSAFNQSTAISYRLEIVLEWDYEFYDQDATL